MANIRKTFNFRNGVQVDDDNLVVNPLGLVGIGTTVPTEILDVRGTAKIVGLVTANQIYTPSLTVTTGTIENLSISTSIIGAGVSIRSGIITASGTGVVTYYGDGANLLNLPTSQWIDTDVGLGFTSIYATGFVGVGTNDPRYAFQVAGTNNLGAFTNGVGIDSTGNIRATGIITASQFYGVGSNLTLINADNISSGTIATARVPQLANSNIPNNLNLSGVVTATGGFIGTVGGNIFGNVTGNVTGNLIGIATTARSLIGNPDILVNNITATSIAATSITSVTSIGATNANVTGIVTTQSLHIGAGGTALSASFSGKLGIGSVTPTKDVQILKTGLAEIELIGSSESQIILGQQKTSGAGIGDSTAVIRFGNTARAFDLINGDQGDFNYYLNAGFPVVGFTTGSFKWFYGQNLAAPLMTLTYGGDLGIGKTNPDHKIHVVGTSTVTGNAWFGGNVSISGNVTVSGSLSGNIFAVEATRVYQTSGVSTIYNASVSNNLTVGSSVGIGTTLPTAPLDARNKLGLFGNIGIGTTTTTNSLSVVGSSVLQSVAIGGTNLDDGSGVGVYGGTTTLSSNSVSGINSTIVILDSTCAIGVGTTQYRSAADFSGAGSNHFGGVGSFMIVPIVTDGQRTGLSTYEGAIVFNTTTKKFQGYTGIAWTDFH